MESVVNEDNIDPKDACVVLSEVIIVFLGLTRTALDKIKALEEDTAVQNLKDNFKATNTEIEELKKRLEEMSKRNEKLGETVKKHEARFKRMEQELVNTKRKHEDEVKEVHEQMEVCKWKYTSL